MRKSVPKKAFKMFSVVFLFADLNINGTLIIELSNLRD